MDKQVILSHFNGNFTAFYSKFLVELRRAGNEYKARCPFHEEKTPSLSINPDKGLFHCFGCSADGDIFSFYSKLKNINGDFPAVLAGIAADFGISNNGAPQLEKVSGTLGKIVKRYSYRGVDGEVLFTKNRHDPKDFRLCRPDGKDGYVLGMGGVEVVLYNLPAVLKADEVWIVEGEKDADNLIELGFTATTNFDGAGKWRDSYSQYLKDKNVVLIPDADDPGRAHMQKVAAALHGVAASVKILELPNPTCKGYDVSDFIAEQGDPNTVADQLSIMAKGLAEWTPLPDSDPNIETSSGFQFIHNADILADLRPIEWRIQDVLPDYAFYYNFGDPGHFKTFIEIDRLLCIASGLEYHGHKVKQGTVFYICGEGWQGIGRRIAAWHLAHGTKAADVPFFVSKTATQLMDQNAIQNVRQAVDTMTKRYGLPAAVHIDTLARNFGDGDENATRDMNTVISNLDLAFGNDFCRGLTHHTGHGSKDRARGSMALHGAADIAYRVSFTDSGLVKVECKKMKDASNAPTMLFNRREIPLQIGDEKDRSYVMELAAEGDEAEKISKPKKAAEPKGNLHKALVILRQLYASHVENPRKGGRSCATPSVSFVDWRTACMDAGLYKRTDNFRNAAEKLLRQGLIRFDEAEKYVYLFEIVAEDDN